MTVEYWKIKKPEFVQKLKTISLVEFLKLISYKFYWFFISCIFSLVIMCGIIILLILLKLFLDWLLIIGLSQHLTLLRCIVFGLLYLFSMFLVYKYLLE